MLSSSLQATLAGRFGTSEYGLSKRDGDVKKLTDNQKEKELAK
jgi:hypothetical protein